MATAPVAPAPSSTVILANELTWVQKHERLIIVFMVLLVGGWLGNKMLDNSAANAKTQLAAQQQISSAAASAADLAAKNYQMTIDALSKQNSALAASVAQRQAILVQKQTEIKAEPLPQVADEWNKLIGLSGSVISSTNDFSVTNDAARATVAQLEEVPVLRADLTDQIKITNNQKTELGNADILISDLHKQISVNGDTCKLALASANANARKSKRNWFIAGFVAGIATRLIGKF